MKRLKIFGLIIPRPKIVISLWLVMLIVIVAVFGDLKTSHPTNMLTDGANPSMKLVFAKLSIAQTDVCRDLGNKTAIEKYMNSLPNKVRLQGSCCNLMVFSKFFSQIYGLKQYSGISQIPSDPYNVSATSAKQMLSFYDTIHLTSSQQSIYNSAKVKTADNGWCCCQCWAWYTHAGLAKYLITQHNYSFQQIVAVTNLEDCCGGA